MCGPGERPREEATESASGGIQLNHVGFRYGARPVLHDVPFDVATGEVVGLLGANGAGKTTVTRLLSTALPWQEGHGTICGRDCRTDPLGVRRTVAVVPQGSTVNLELTVAQNMMTYLVLHGSPVRDARRRMQDMVEVFGLGPYLSTPCRALSGGFRRRVQVARALATSARCIILDEASTGLDAVMRRDLWAVIKQAAARRTVLLTTQILDEAETCDRLIFLREGRVVAHGTPDTLRRVHGRARLRVTLDERVTVDAIRCAVRNLRVDVAAFEPGAATFHMPGATDVGTVLQALFQAVIPVVTTELMPPSMEDVFLAVMGR